MNQATTNLPYITNGLPGIGGEIKNDPGDFVVEELPLYEPSGQGPHIYVRLSRTGWNTRDLAKSLANLFQLKDVDVGYAGLKDKHAQVTQTFSLNLSGMDLEAATARIEENMPVKVVWTKRHANKLKMGHLLGNRFSILVLGADTGAVETSRAVADLLAKRGLPNYYGVQRFGVDGDNAEKGREVLEGRGPKSRWLRRFLLSAYQARLFNSWLTERIERGWFELLLGGDLAKKVDTGGMFDVEDPEVENVRFKNGEITYTGPIYGMKMRWAKGTAGLLEREIFDRFNLTDTLLSRARLDGSRRPARLALPILNISPSSNGLLFDFALPKGAYATVVMREFMKTDPGLSE